MVLHRLYYTKTKQSLYFPWFKRFGVAVGKWFHFVDVVSDFGLGVSDFISVLFFCLGCKDRSILGRLRNVTNGNTVTYIQCTHAKYFCYVLESVFHLFLFWHTLWHTFTRLDFFIYFHKCCEKISSSGTVGPFWKFWNNNLLCFHMTTHCDDSYSHRLKINNKISYYWHGYPKMHCASRDD